ncbi:MAG: DUF1376 domain-containing protein [Alphaproteobacteria bacterium]|nr:DUF1376 domain-containing protein [Alphaproteobacteria bacterium]MBF0394333.1 DUF1376 domain-containing protein [Alphaproteobacteria bacterium]
MKPRRIDFSPDELIAGITGKLDPLEFGVFWMICTLIYSNGGPIANDEAWISRIFRKTNPRTIRAAIDRLIEAGKIERTGTGELMVKRCRTELESALKRMRNAAENGAKGGRPQSKNNDLGKPTGCSDQKLSSTTTINTNRDSGGEIGIRARPRSPQEALFEAGRSVVTKDRSR